MTVNASGATITGLSGSFSSVDLRIPNARAEQTLIAFVTSSRELRVMDWDGANERVVTIAPQSITSLSWSPGGSSIYYSTSDGAFNRVSITGGAPVTLFTNARVAQVSPLGTQVAFVRSGNVYISAIDGSGATLILDHSTDVNDLEWAQPGMLLCGSNGSVFPLTSTGTAGGVGAAGNLIGGMRRTQVLHVTREIAANDHTYTTMRYTLGSGSFEQTDLTVRADDGSVSHDDRFVIVAERPQDDTTGLSSIVRRTSTLGSPVTLRSSNWVVSPVTLVACQPLPTSRPVAGAGTLYGTPATAVIWSVSGLEFGGIALATAQTPSTLRISATEPTSTGPNVLFTVEADRLTKLSYSIDKGLSLGTVAVNANTNGAFLNFLSSTGECLNAIIYTVTRSTGKPKVERVGNRHRITGTITAVYDKSGKNLVPNGASQVSVGQDGKVLIGG